MDTSLLLVFCRKFLLAKGKDLRLAVPVRSALSVVVMVAVVASAV